MALFQGEEMVDVQTPDGRTLTLPRSIIPANILPQQQIAQPIPLPGVAPLEAPGLQPQELVEADLMPPTPQAQGIAEPGEPDVTPVTMMAPEVVTANPKRVAKARAAQEAQAASPQGQRAADNAQQTSGIASEANARLDASVVEGAEQDAVAHALTDRNEQIDKLFAARAAEAQKNADAEEAKMGEIVSLRKKIAGTKIDRKHDHPVLAAIGIMLAAIGRSRDGIKDGNNPAVDAFYATIDRKVQGQMADLDQMGKIYGYSKEELEMLKNKSKSRLEFHGAMIAGETDKAVRHIEELTARSASEKTRANAKIMIAQLQQRANDKSTEALWKGLEFDQKEKHQKQQIGLGYANLKESKRSNVAGEQLKREGMYFDYQQALAATKQKGDEVQYKAMLESDKEVRELGIKGADNEFLLTPAGKLKMEEAGKLEAEAAALESNPDVMARSIASDKIALMKQKAAIMRGEARSFDAVKLRNAPVATKIGEKFAAAQTMMDTVDEINMLHEQAGRGLISKSKLQEEVQAKVGLLSVAAKDAWQLGAWDKGSAALVQSIIGQDPTTEWNVGVIGSLVQRQMLKDPEGFKNRLKAVTLKLEQDVQQQIMKNSSNWDGKGALFTRKFAAEPNTPVNKASAGLTQGRSGLELEKNAEKVGTVGKTARAIGYPLSPSHAEEAENAKSVQYPGLSKEQDPEFDALLGAYKAGDAKAGDALIAKVANEAAKRPDFAIPLLHNLREHARKLYPAARAAVPRGSEVDKQMSYEENQSIGAAAQYRVNPGMFIQGVIDSVDSNGKVADEEGYRELVRAASRKDPAAAKALMDIISLSGNRKTLPPGAVFRGGK